MSKGFFRGLDFDEDQQFSCPILKSAAGLRHAHLKLSAAALHADDLEVTCIGPEPQLRLWVSEPAATPFFSAAEDILGYMYSIDRDVHALLGEPNPAATTHHEAIGSTIGRLAFFHSLAFPQGPNVFMDAGPVMKLLMPECLRYDDLAAALMKGELRLPPLSTTAV